MTLYGKYPDDAFGNRSDAAHTGATDNEQSGMALTKTIYDNTLVFRGTVTGEEGGSETTDFYSTVIIGFDDDYFNDYHYVVFTNNCTNVAGQCRVIGAYVSATGKITFNNVTTGDIKIGDEFLIIPDYIANIGGISGDSDVDTSATNPDESGTILERLAQLQEAINKGTGTSLPANKSIYDAHIGGIDAVNRKMGRTQIKEVSITAAANAGLTTVATITTQPCLIKSVVIHADAAQTADMTTCAVEGGTGQVVEFIGTTAATQANLDAADKQVSMTPADGAVRLVATKTITIDLQGTGATAVDLTVIIEYVACVDGGYLA